VVPILLNIFQPARKVKDPKAKLFVLKYDDAQST